MATTDKRALEGKVAAELHQIAADLGIEGHKGLKKADLVDKIIAHTNGERADASSVAAAAPDATMASIDTTTSPTSGQAYVDMRETSGNGDTRQRPQPDQRDQRQRDDRREGTRPQGGRPDAGQQQRDREGGPRRRPSREERRRQREERRQREIEMREEELQTAPTATGLLDILP
ncbi:MAG TPA: Rho termination factor N-terminal domain-containing protein, partial [Gaiellaceae bacterium]|nr:Rho termination factor N-terminal domain-containing protein [Gaiellaceae bacterium]